MNSCRTITHYRHESFAHERIYSSVMQLYKGNRKEEIHTLLSKIEFIIKLVIYGMFYLMAILNY